VDRALVINASPLILLARIDRLDLLVSRAKPLVVPEAVIQEIQLGSDRDGTAGRVKALPSIFQVDDRPVPERVRLWNLGAGESQVLAHALERPGAEVVLDDLAARRCARSLGLLGGVVPSSAPEGARNRLRPPYHGLKPVATCRRPQGALPPGPPRRLVCNGMD
jgi:predicted nucleic acid-binding protein